MTLLSDQPVGQEPRSEDLVLIELRRGRKRVVLVKPDGSLFKFSDDWRSLARIYIERGWRQVSSTTLFAKEADWKYGRGLLVHPDPVARR